MAVAAVACIAMCCRLLRDQPVFLEWRRPANVPSVAVFVEWSKGGAWERCQYCGEENLDHCTVWNWGGGVISDEVYYPFDKGPAIKSDQLRIQREVPSGIGDDAICLENGRTLIPKWLVDAHNEGRFRDLFDRKASCPDVSGKRW